MENLNEDDPNIDTTKNYIKEFGPILLSSNLTNKFTVILLLYSSIFKDRCIISTQVEVAPSH